jgi:hypothetical protein
VTFNERDHYEYIDVGGRIMLKWNLERWDKDGMDCIDLA